MSKIPTTAEISETYQKRMLTTVDQAAKAVTTVERLHEAFGELIREFGDVHVSASYGTVDAVVSLKDGKTYRDAFKFVRAVRKWYRFAPMQDTGVFIWRWYPCDAWANEMAPLVLQLWTTDTSGCKRVQVGTEVREVPIYKTICDGDDVEVAHEQVSE